MISNKIHTRRIQRNEYLDLCGRIKESPGMRMCLAGGETGVTKDRGKSMGKVPEKLDVVYV